MKNDSGRSLIVQVHSEWCSPARCSEGLLRKLPWEHVLLENDNNASLSICVRKEEVMKQLWRSLALGSFAALALSATGCMSQPSGNSNSVSTGPSPTASPSPSPSPNIETKTVAVTLPVLDALFSDEAFKEELKIGRAHV